MTNRQFAQKNEEFLQACSNVPWKDKDGNWKDKDGKLITLPPTTRQASKWRRERGLAFKIDRRKGRMK